MEASEEEAESRGARPWEAFLAIMGTWILNWPNFQRYCMWAESKESRMMPGFWPEDLE